MTVERRFGYVITVDGSYIGYRVDGDGPIDVVHQPEWPGNIDLEWESPWYQRWFGELMNLGRLIMHDHRGVGLSSRNVALPTLETRVADLARVLDHVQADRPVLTGYLSSGAVNVLAAAMNPTLARAIVWFDPMARYASAPDYPWGVSEERLAGELAHLSSWGTDGYARWFWSEQEALDATASSEDATLMARQSRNACTPDVARALAMMWCETDVRGVLSSVQTPTLLLVHGGSASAVEHAEYVASLMPNASVCVKDSTSWSVDEVDAWIEEIRRFIGVQTRPVHGDRVLSSVLFTDIVDSTRRATEMGDGAWKGLLGRHDEIARDRLERFGGRFVHTTGDGMLATFDGPARAVSCAREIVESVRSLGLEIRAGVHTGEIELVGDDVQGLAVHIGARVAGIAGSSEVLVSRTVKDLTAGSGLAFEDAGEHELKGVPDRWRLYRVVDG